MKNASENQQNATAHSEMFEFNLLQLVNYLFSHRWFIVIGTSLCVATALLWVIFVKQRVYRATVTINIDLTADEKMGAGMTMGGGFFMQDQMVNNKIGITEQYFDSEEFRVFLFRSLTTEDVPEMLKDDVEIVKNELVSRQINGKDDISDWIHSKIDLKGITEKSRIDLTGSAARPDIAAAIANVGAHALVEYNRLMLLQRVRNLKKFLNAQTLQTRKELHALEIELVDLQKSAKIISPEEVRARVNSLQVDQDAKLIEYERQLAALNTLITETESDLSYFKKLMQENKASSYLYLEQIQKRLEILRFQKMQATGSRGVADAEESPIDQSINTVLQDLSKQLDTLGPIASSPWDYVKKIETALFDLKQKRSQAKSELLAQRQARSRTNREFIGLPDSLKRLSEIKRNIDLTTSLFTALMTRLQDTQIREAAHANDLVIVSSAVPPTAPSGLGRTKTMMLSLIGGLILSCLPLFLRFVLLPTIRNVKDLAHMSVPIIGAIGWYRPSVKNLTLNLQDRKSRILKEASASPEANSLRFVRFQLEQSLSIRANQAGQASKLLMVGSVNPKEGRTFIAANLADLFANSGIRTCIIDLDFGKPEVHKYFPEGVREASPMTELFPQECGFEMYRVSDRLTVLKPNPRAENMSETIAMRDFESALNALEILFELIILDTPPLTGHMEPIMTAQYADAFLLVVNQRRTLRNEVEDAIRVVQGSLKLPIFGVMNFIFDEVSQVRRKIKKFDRSSGRNEPPGSDSSRAA